MKIIYHSLVTVLWGYLSHRTYAYTRTLGNGWSQITAYTVGSIAVLPALLEAHELLGERERAQAHPIARLFLAWILAYGSFGLGTVIGWLHRPYEGPMADSGTE